VCCVWQSGTPESSAEMGSGLQIAAGHNGSSFKQSIHVYVEEVNAKQVR
jgi:hypothetical protein